MGREKTREGGERRGKTLGQEGWLGLNGSELGARVTGAEITVMSSTMPRSSAPETLAPRRVHFLNSLRQESIYEKLLKKD